MYVLECPPGTFGLNCTGTCVPYYFGRLCRSKCDCPLHQCDLKLGCRKRNLMIKTHVFISFKYAIHLLARYGTGCVYDDK